MSRNVVTAIAVIGGLAAFASISLPSVTSASRPAVTEVAASGPVTEVGPAAPTAKHRGFARPGPWAFEGKVDLHDSGALELKIRSTAGVPRAFDLVSRLLVGRDVLLVDTRVSIADVNGRAVALNRLDDAILRVRGTLLPAGQWRYDLDGEATPTLRASRIIVLAFD